MKKFRLIAKKKDYKIGKLLKKKTKQQQKKRGNGCKIDHTQP